MCWRVGARVLACRWMGSLLPGGSRKVSTHEYKKDKAHLLVQAEARCRARAQFHQFPSEDPGTQKGAMQVVEPLSVLVRDDPWIMPSASYALTLLNAHLPERWALDTEVKRVSVSVPESLVLAVGAASVVV